MRWTGLPGGSPVSIQLEVPAGNGARSVPPTGWKVTASIITKDCGIKLAGIWGTVQAHSTRDVLAHCEASPVGSFGGLIPSGDRCGELTVTGSENRGLGGLVLKVRLTCWAPTMIV